MNLQNFNLSKESINYVGANNEGERTFNDKTFKMLYDKKKNLEKQFKNYIKEKDLLSFYVFKPNKIDVNSEMKFKINKNDLNDLLVKSEQMKLHKEIYKTKLFNLINPYYLVAEKYIKQTDISPNLQKKLLKEKEELKIRENTIYNNKFYDSEKQIYFELPPKDHPLNTIKNEKVLNDAVKSHCLIVRLKNEEDGFNKARFYCGRIEIIN